MNLAVIGDVRLLIFPIMLGVLALSCVVFLRRKDLICLLASAASGLVISLLGGAAYADYSNLDKPTVLWAVNKAVFLFFFFAVIGFAQYIAFKVERLPVGVDKLQLRMKNLKTLFKFLVRNKTHMNRLHISDGIGVGIEHDASVNFRRPVSGVSEDRHEL